MAILLYLSSDRQVLPGLLRDKHCTAGTNYDQMPGMGVWQEGQVPFGVRRFSRM